MDHHFGALTPSLHTTNATMTFRSPPFCIGTKVVGHHLAGTTSPLHGIPKASTSRGIFSASREERLNIIEIDNTNRIYYLIRINICEYYINIGEPNACLRLALGHRCVFSHDFRYTLLNSACFNYWLTTVVNMCRYVSSFARDICSSDAEYHDS